jgi:hypothetical protein
VWTCWAKDNSCPQGDGAQQTVRDLFHHATQKGVQFQTYEIIFFWNFPFNIFEPGITKTTEKAISDKVEPVLKSSELDASNTAQM